MRHILRYLARAFCAGLLVVAATTSSAAQSNLNDDEISAQSVKIYDALVTFPPPIWIDRGNPLDQSEIFRNQNGPTFVIEQISKDETFEAWTRMYAITGLYLGDRPKPNADQFMEFILRTQSKNCGLENFTVRSVTNSATSRTMVSICETMANASADLRQRGFSSDVGNISLIKTVVVANTLIQFSHEWRGPRFQSADEATWPVSRTDLQRMATRYQKAEAREYR